MDVVTVLLKKNLEVENFLATSVKAQEFHPAFWAYRLCLYIVLRPLQKGTEHSRSLLHFHLVHEIVTQFWVLMLLMFLFAFSLGLEIEPGISHMLSKLIWSFPVSLRQCSP